MDITNPTSTQTSATSSTQSTAGSAFGDSAAEQFTTFLTLLTAQIENQDPLSPLDSTQFVEQLATFSALEQQVQGNQYLENINSTMTTFLNATAGEWVGQTVEVESSFVPFSGQDIEYTASIPDGTTNAVLKVEDLNGVLVYSEDLDTSDESWFWRGVNNDGQDVVPNLYKVSIELFNDGTFQGSIAPRLITEVAVANIEDGKLRLGFDNKLSEYAENVRKRD